jgi:hypothetical protein
VDGKIRSVGKASKADVPQFDAKDLLSHRFFDIVHLRERN